MFVTVRGEGKTTGGKRYAALIPMLKSKVPKKDDPLVDSVQAQLLSVLSQYANEPITKLTQWDIYRDL